jgi:predicted enzyme related to lactoylglutathione lyase
VEYWLVTTGPDGQPGINGGLLKRRGGPPASGQPVNAFVCTAGVDSLDATLAALAGAGGTMALPTIPVPGLAGVRTSRIRTATSLA